MAGTTSEARSNGDNNEHQHDTKRKAEDSPAPKDTKKSKTESEQQTIEDTMQLQTNGSHGMKHTNGNGNDATDAGKDDHSSPKPDATLKEAENDVDVQAKESEDPTAKPSKDNNTGSQSEPQSTTHQGEAVKEDKDREEAMPSNMLEKGIIYFFTRGRVGIEDLESVQDLQRSHFVLRPIPDGGKLGDGTIDNAPTARLIALPKKVWPKSGKDRFMAFVESAKVSIKDLKEDFLKGSEYETKTLGTRQTPPVTPVGEGVYAITSTGDRGESHLVYMLTIPKEPGNLQEDIGIGSKGSFVISLKNPEVKGPANASLPQKPDYPKEFFDEFRNRSWMPVEPKHIDYQHAQMLLIGENFDSGHALEATKKDEEDDDKETPKEELEKLENEDQIRIRHLKGDDSIYADLDIKKKDYPDVATTW